MSALRWILAVAILLSLGLMMPQMADANGMKFSDAKKALKDQLKSLTATTAQKIEAVERMAAYDGTSDAKAAVKELLGVLEDKTLFTDKAYKTLEAEFAKAEADFKAMDAKCRNGNTLMFGGANPTQQDYQAAQQRMEQARQRLSMGNDVKQAIVNTLVQMRSAAAREEMLATLKTKTVESVGACVIALQRQGMTEAFDAIQACYESNSDGGVRGLCIQALRMLDKNRAAPLMFKALQDDGCWLGRNHAIAAMREMRSKEAVDALVERLSKEPPGRLQWDIFEALQDLTGKDFQDVSAWRTWWSSAKTTFAPAPPRPRSDSGNADPNAPKGARGTGISFYGIPVRGNPLFIIDRSGSMLESTQHKPGDPSAQNGGQLPPGHKSKWQVLQEELSKAVEGLPETARFALVWFDTDVAAYKNGAIVTATAAEKKAAIAEVMAMKANSLTNIRDAFERGFEIIRSGGVGAGKVVVTGAKDGGLPIDEIFFMTDGSATAGKPIDNLTPTNGGDNREYTAKMLELICEWNKPYNLVINCICVGEGDQNFLRKLAERNRGKFQLVR